MILVFLSPIQTLRVLPFDVASHTVLFQGFNSHRKHFRSWVFSLHSFFHFGNQIQSFIPKQIFFETIFETCSGTSGGVTGIVLSGGYILFWLSWCFPKMKSQAWWKSQNPFTNLLGSLSRKYRGCHSKRIMAAQACWCKHNADWKCWQIYQSQQKIIYTKKLQVLHSEMRNEIMHLFISSFYSLSDLSALWRGTPLKCVSICAVKTLQLAQTANKLHRAAPYRWQYLQLGSQTADPLWAAR